MIHTYPSRVTARCVESERINSRIVTRSTISLATFSLIVHKYIQSASLFRRVFLVTRFIILRLFRVYLIFEVTRSIIFSYDFFIDRSQMHPKCEFIPGVKEYSTLV